MRYNNLIKYLIKHKWWVLLAALTIISAAFRFWRLGYINEYIFDEVYYAKMAQDYIIGVSFFDVHPPMVKLIIELGIRLFGDNSVGWRFFEAFFGTLIVPLTFLIADKLFNNKRVAFLAALFISIDGLMLVQSRTALLDSPLIVFDLAAYLTFLICLDTVSKVKAKWWLLGTGIFLGLAAASKWTAIAPFLVIFSFPLYYRKKSLNVPAWYAAIALGIVPFVIYIASFLANHGPSGFFEYVITWHQQTWNYQATLKATHPYASRWYTWLYIYRPVWYYFKQFGDQVVGVIALGNPILWWLSIPALALSVVQIVRKKTPELILPLVAFCATYLPWCLIQRLEFQYYVIGGVPFMFMLLAWWFDKALGNQYSKISAIGVIVFAIGIFFYFFPLLTGIPVGYQFYLSHMWFSTWI